MTTTTDRIEKQILLRAPRSRVWRAITDVKEFNEWFRVNLEGTFAPGARLSGKITYPGYEHVTMEVEVERVEPERVFSFRCPHEVEPDGDPASRPTTLVEFTLEEAPEGTMLTIVESGFENLPASARARILRDNDGGWAEQLRNIERHVDRAA